MPVRLVNNDAVYSVSVAYTYRAEIEIERVHPVLGAREGGTLLTLYGTGFLDTTTTRCRFALVDVPARLLAPGQLECRTPMPATSGYVMLEVSTNGQDFSSSGVQYEYLRPVSVWSVEPSQGPTGGGTFVNVSGNAIPARSAQLGYVWCRFNTTVVAAAWVSTSEVHCVAPAHAAGMVVVELTVNEQEFTNDGVHFEYEVVSAYSVYPSSGPVLGGTSVEVRGSSI